MSVAKGLVLVLFVVGLSPVVFAGPTDWLLTSPAEHVVMPRGSQARLENVVRSLNLTERGAQRWLSLIRLDLPSPDQERVLAVTRAGRVVDSLIGEVGKVLLQSPFNNRLLQSGADLVLVHNHPNDRGLSADDLANLAKPGVAAVAAIGHEGSVYVAAAGRFYDRNDLAERQCALVRATLLRELGLQQAAHVLTPDIGADHFSHLMSLALERAGVIEYRATLARDRRASYERHRQPLLEVILTAAARLQRH